MVVAVRRGLTLAKPTTKSWYILGSGPTIELTMSLHKIRSPDTRPVPGSFSSKSYSTTATVPSTGLVPYDQCMSPSLVLVGKSIERARCCAQKTNGQSAVNTAGPLTPALCI